jgi:hypothetical protein
MRLKPAILCLVVCSVVRGGEVEFAAGPTVRKVGETAKVAFSVSAPTDVEVAVLDADGAVVRHLAAGVLGGGTPPPPPLVPGLKQALTWDGKTDTGEAAAGGPFRVRARLDTGLALDGFVGEHVEWLYQLCGLATDGKGRLYVYSTTVADHRGHSRLMQVYDRDGAYLRTIMPMPANLPEEKLVPFSATFRYKNTMKLDPPGEHVVPRNFFGTWPEFYPGRMGCLLPRVTADGVLAIADNAGFAVARLTNEGACVGDRFWRNVHGKRLWNWRHSRGARCFVVSPDGRFLYLSGFGGWDDKKKQMRPAWPLGRIYRTEPATGKPLEQWVALPDGDEPARAGAACFDPDGNLLVFNGGTGRVVALDPTGRTLGSFDAMCKLVKQPTGPARLFCHRKTGEIYATYLRQLSKKGRARYQFPRKLAKFAPWKRGGAKLCEFGLPTSHRAYGLSGHIAYAALDDSADPAVVWVGSVAGTEPNSYLLRLVDRGKTFEKTLDLMDRSRGVVAVKSRMAVHPDTNVIIYNNGYNRVAGLNGLTGDPVKLPFTHGVDMGIGLDGHWYVQTGRGYSGPICRFDKDLKPLPVPGRTAGKGKPPTNAVGSVYGRMGAGYCAVGVTADPRGRAYSLQMWKWAAYGVAVFGPDGTPEDPGRMKDHPEMKKCPRFDSVIIGPMPGRCGGVQVDWAGNIYLGLKILPAGYQAPKGFEHKHAGYYSTVGSIIKFGPDGGAFHRAGKEPREGALPADLAWAWGDLIRRRYDILGAERMYPGLSVISGGFGDGCMCRQPMFVVDGWDRIWYPSAVRNRIEVVDNHGNLIERAGRYGNVDSRGPDENSPIKTPEIPIGWPQAVSVSRRYVYASDVLNRRIIRLKKTYAAEAVCEVK